MAGERGFRVEAFPTANPDFAKIKAYLGEVIQWAARFWPLMIAPLLLLSLLDRFAYPSPDAPFSDLTISHYPNALYLLRSLQEWRQLPLWSPTILGGYPFMANPLSGLWYPPGWLALLLPLPFGFNLVAALHLLWGGVGMYRLLRLEGLGHSACLFGALAFEAMPKLFAHYGAGHLTLIYAVPWTPWLLFAWQSNFIKEKGNKQRLFGDLTPGIVLGLIFLADVRWSAFAGALWWAWALAHSHFHKALSTLSGLIKNILFAALIAAPLALPLLEITRLSSRSSLSVGDVLAFSLPTERLLGFIIPGTHGSHEWVVYPGAAVLIMGLLPLLSANQASGRHVLFWTGMFIVGILFSLGSQLPFGEFLSRLPLIELQRVPARAMFLSGIALAALAANGLEKMQGGLESEEKRRVKFTLLGLMGIPSGLVVAIGGLASRIPPGFTWGAFAFLASGVWSWLGIRLPRKLSPVTWLTGLLLIASLDLVGVEQQVLAGRRSESVLAEGEAVAKYLTGKPGQFRVYSPSYSIPQQTAAYFRLELVDGVDPLQLESLAEFMEKASGVPRVGYSVTLPPFATGMPDVDNIDYRPDPKRLGLLNVGYVVAEYDLPVPGLWLAARFGETRVYENKHFRPRAWVQAENSPTVIEPVDGLLWTPNEITVTATGPGILVLSEVTYPGWQARVDGDLRKIQVIEGLLRGVRLEPGEHRVIFEYRPASLLTGLGLSLAALLFLASRAVLLRVTWEGKQEEKEP